LRGYADKYSALEIPVFWQILPSDSVRHALIEVLSADLLYPYNGPSLEDNLLICSFQVDLWHGTVAYDGRIIDDLSVRCST
jgi:hypothetical protein